MTKIHMVCVTGARPNFVKMAPISAVLRGRAKFAVKLVKTGQHASAELSTQFFDELELSQPEINLEIGKGTPTQQTADIMRRLEPILSASRPDVVFVVGDVKSTLAAALVVHSAGTLGWQSGKANPDVLEDQLSEAILSSRLGEQ